MTVPSFATSGYASAALPLRTERGTEYAVFASITARMRKAQSEDASMAQRAAALHDNRRLWITLATDLAAPDNALPQELRARLIYLAEFSLRQSQQALSDPSAIQGLIDVNTSVMRGLDGSREAA